VTTAAGGVPVLELDQVTKVYPGSPPVRALERVSLAVAGGELVAVAGPSGSGKSTLLHLMGTLDRPSSGTVRITGLDVARMADRELSALRARRIGFIFQQFFLAEQQTVLGNVADGLLYAGVRRGARRRLAADALDRVGLGHKAAARPVQLSGGQRQRVAMGRAIVRKPKAFLMDEPLSNLDAKLRVQMRGEIARLQRRLGTTTIYVTHDQTEAMTLGDRVVIMRGGVVQQIGAPDELYERPANLFVAGFIGSPAMNFFPGTLTVTGLKLPFGEVTLTQPVHDVLAQHPAPDKVIVGVRPEHLHDAALIDGYQRISALTFEVNVDMVESLGADKYIYFTAEGLVVHSDQLSELEEESEGEEHEFVARVPAASKAAKGKPLELAFDTVKLAVFDADTGVNLTVPPPPEEQ